ncbi:MAG: hypothetical protein WBA44_00070 [Mesorhizobium sp.]
MTLLLNPHPLSVYAFILRACQSSFDWETTAYFPPDIMTHAGVPLIKQAFEHSSAERLLRERELEKLRKVGVPEISLIEPLPDDVEKEVRRRVEAEMLLLRIYHIDTCNSRTAATWRKMDTTIAQGAISGVAWLVRMDAPNESRRKRLLATCEILNRGIPTKDRADMLQLHHVRNAVASAKRKYERYLASDPSRSADQCRKIMIEPAIFALLLLDLDWDRQSEFRRLKGRALADALDSKGMLGTLMVRNRQERLSGKVGLLRPQIDHFKSAVP